MPAQVRSRPVKFRRAQDRLASIASEIEWRRAGRDFHILTEFDVATKQNIAYLDRFDSLPARRSGIIGRTIFARFGCRFAAARSVHGYD